MGTQGPKAGGQGLAQPPEADDQDPGVVEGDGQLLQGDLERAFGGGWSVSGRVTRKRETTVCGCLPFRLVHNALIADVKITLKH